MNELISKAINQAIEIIIINKGIVDKLEGKGWKVYRVGKIIRVDIDQQE